MNRFLDYLCHKVVFFLYNFSKNQKGITSIEYALMGVAIAFFIVAILYGDNTFLTATEAKFKLFTDKVATALFSTN